MIQLVVVLLANPGLFAAQDPVIVPQLAACYNMCAYTKVPSANSSSAALPFLICLRSQIVAVASEL